MRSRFVLAILAAFVIPAAPAWGQTTPAPAPSASAAMTNVLAPTLATPPLQTITFEACNQMKYTIAVAVAYPEGNSETSRGWEPIQPDTCSTMGPFPLNRNRFSFYGTGDRGRKTWEGSTNFCVNSRDIFTYQNAYRAASGSLCPDQNSTRPFISVTPAMLLPKDPDKRNDPALKFKFTFN